MHWKIRIIQSWIFIGLERIARASSDPRSPVSDLVGVRTWGGSTGIEPHQNLVDGGRTTPPQFGLHGLDGTWPIEGWGVEPQIVIVNMPAEVVAGQDTQLDYAIDHLLQQVANGNGKWEIPDAARYPNKAQPNMSGVQPE